MELSAIELKFLLRLLEHPPDYRTLISQIKPNSKTTAAERDRTCRNLCSKGLVEYEVEIQRYRTTAAGKTLLNLDASVLPITPDERQMLKAAATAAATPGQAQRVAAADRQRTLRQLEERGLISVGKQQIKTIGLTQAGLLYLRDSCAPSSANAMVPLAMVGSYLQFMRQFMNATAATKTANMAAAPDPGATPASELSAPELLTLIQQLDQQLNTDNYLPIFHLREKLEPALSRAQLDALLYDLQRQDRIELGTLQDVSAYGESQLAAGIPQEVGGALFFISVL